MDDFRPRVERIQLFSGWRARAIGLGAVVAVLAGCASAPEFEPIDPVVETPEAIPTPESDPLQEPLSGIIALQPHGDSFSDGFSIIGIDPITGDSEVQRVFPPSSTATPEVSLFTPIFTRMAFDTEFHRVAVRLSDPDDGSAQVGWLEDDGVIVNVSEAIASGGSDFSAAIDHVTPMFGPDGAFYFSDDSEMTVKRVTTESPSSAADAAVVFDYSDDYSDPAYLWVYPSGTIDVAYGGAIPQVENTLPGVWAPGRVEDFVTDVTLITGDSDNANLYLSDASENGPGSSGWFGSGTPINRRPLLPDRAGRLSWNPVASPDGSQVAFLSAPDTGDDPAQVFIVSVDGGEPQLLATQYAFEKLSGGGFFGPSSYVQLLDWK